MSASSLFTGIMSINARLLSYQDNALDCAVELMIDGPGNSQRLMFVFEYCDSPTVFRDLAKQLTEMASILDGKDCPEISEDPSPITDVAANELADLKMVLGSAQVQIADLYVDLQELVYLKNLKDRHGKTQEYELRKPKAWKEARRLLGDQV